MACATHWTGQRAKNMRIVELSLFAVRLPLKREVRHASAARSESENLVARCRLADGGEGWGEGVPRPYVTGETIAGAFAQLAATRLAEELDADCVSWDGVLALCDRLQLHKPGEDPRGCYGNALRCAIELSILDAFGRLFHQPLSAATHCFGPACDVRGVARPGPLFRGHHPRRAVGGKNECAGDSALRLLPLQGQGRLSRHGRRRALCGGSGAGPGRASTCGWTPTRPGMLARRWPGSNRC